MLQNAPYGLRADEAKVGLGLSHSRVTSESPLLPDQNITLQTLLTILNSTKSTDISGAIRLLPQDDQDTLMKYLYRGMATPGGGDISCSILLAWHEKVCIYVCVLHALRVLTRTQLTEIAGTGCIVRTMTDRRIV